MGFFQKLFGHANTPEHASHPAPSAPRPTTTPTRDQILARYQRAEALARGGDTRGTEVELRAAMTMCFEIGETRLLIGIADQLAEVVPDRTEAKLVLEKCENYCAEQGNGIGAIWLMHSRAVFVRNDGDHLGAMRLFKAASDHCDAMCDYLSKDGKAGIETQVRQLQRRVVWDMSPDASEAIGFDRSANYQRVVEAWVSVARRSGDPAQHAESLLLLAMSPYKPSGLEVKPILDEALRVAEQSHLEQLGAKIAAYKQMYALIGQRE